MQAHQKVLSRRKNICHFDFIRVAFPFAFHPGSVAQVSFFFHKCTRQLRQMPNNRRRFLLWHENAAVTLCTRGPRDLLAEVQNVRPPQCPVLTEYSSTGIFKQFCLPKFKRSSRGIRMCPIPFSNAILYWNRCCTGRSCLQEGRKISIISKQRYPGLNYWRV